MLAGALVAWLFWLAWFADLPDPQAAAALNMPAPGILIEDRHGRLLYEAIAANGSRHAPLPLAEIPLACRQATVATEDSRFYQHPGVDLLAIVRAAWTNWRGEGPFSGASTISQQLARNLYMTEDERGERTLRRKLREAWLAWRLERRYSKDELLALYLNTAYYGHFAVGIEAASQAYFGVHARELDLAQCALLAGLVQYPAGYNPLEYPEAARRRQATVLGLMVRDGYISAEQAAEAANERLAFASTPFPIEAPHFVMWVQGQLEDLLGIERVRAGGLRVTTTLDLDWQRQAEEIVRQRMAALRPCAAGPYPLTACDRDADANRRIENAGLVALDPHSGAVLAMVGNPDYFDRAVSGAVNTTLALRQPGSAIKPLTYALVLDPQTAAAAGRRPWTAATLIADVRTVFITAEGQPYVPQNYDRKYHGPVMLRTALANSYNIPAVKALDAVGVPTLIELANRLGISWDRNASWLIPAHLADHPADRPAASGYGLALTLGGGEVRLLDLTAAYAAFANGGMRVTPLAIRRVETLDGTPLFDAEQAAATPPRVLDPRVAYLISDILSDDLARRPTFGPGSALEIGRPAAVKTGTTTDWRDNWTIGYTPELVVGVWVGNADNTPMLGVSGVTGAAPIWRDFMTAVLRNTPPAAFPRPDGLKRVEICADSGLLPGDGDENPAEVAMTDAVAGQTPATCPLRRYEWFIEGTEPTEVDRLHVRVALDTRTGMAATAATPPAFVTHRVYWLLPEEYRDWAQEHSRDLLPPPTWATSETSRAGTQTGAEAQARMATGQQGALAEATLARTARPSPETGTADVVIASPDPNRTYRIDPGLPVSAQKLPITVRLSPGLRAQATTVTLLVDGMVWTTVSGPEYTAWWPLTAGAHTFEAVVMDGEERRIRSASVNVIVE